MHALLQVTHLPQTDASALAGTERGQRIAVGQEIRQGRQRRLIEPLRLLEHVHGHPEGGGDERQPLAGVRFPCSHRLTS